MKLPRGARAVVPTTKLLGYALSGDHPKGRDIARVFRAALGLTDRHAPILAEALLRAAVEQDAVLVSSDQYGSRYQIDFVLKHKGRSAVIRSGWVVPEESPPQLATVFVRRRQGAE